MYRGVHTETDPVCSLDRHPSNSLGLVKLCTESHWQGPCSRPETPAPTRQAWNITLKSSSSLPQQSPELGLSFKFHNLGT